jgi:ribonuclease BN (tRNA processing enzyme)
MDGTIDRRAFLAATASLTAALWQKRWSGSNDPRTRLILLGTGAGPRPRKESSGSAQVIIAGDRLYVIDCGDGVARQLVLAGLSLASLRHVFITHHHSDHNADYGNLLLLAWESGLQQRVDTWGPPPIARITSKFFEMSAYDIETRIADEGRTSLIPMVHVHELTGPGLVMEDDAVKVTSALVDHPLVKPAYAYRFDAADRSIVISGDTTRSANLIKLAAGADVLVHEAIYPAAVDQITARVPNASALRKHLLASHTTAEDCGRIAAEAGVKTLVLSHLAPSDPALVSETMWADAARAHFDGRIIVGRDLMEI